MALNSRPVLRGPSCAARPTRRHFEYPHKFGKFRFETDAFRKATFSPKLPGSKMSDIQLI